ncbi:MAG: 50S ribosomal protein L23 [Candidatus Levybacteria bacterium]|nr:50S ribosomal protein L23 [Candidatus Levybacteria bacterium]
MNIIISPLITEKSMQDAGAGKFSFRVYKSANKNEIKKAIEKAFSVNVIGISTNILKGKKQRVGTRRAEKNVSDWKKAIVTLKKGEKIGLFELGGEEK